MRWPENTTCLFHNLSVLYFLTMFNCPYLDPNLGCTSGRYIAYQTSKDIQNPDFNPIPFSIRYQIDSNSIFTTSKITHDKLHWLSKPSMGKMSIDRQQWGQGTTVAAIKGNNDVHCPPIDCMYCYGTQWQEAASARNCIPQLLKSFIL